MLEPLLGSADSERVLLFITERGEGYGRQIADFWGCSVTGIQRRLDRMESGGVLQAKGVGRTRVYTWNPRWPFSQELQALMRKGIAFLPDEQRMRLQEDRRRPRRRGKPQ